MKGIHAVAILDQPVWAGSTDGARARKRASDASLSAGRWKTIVDVYICKVGEREGWRLMA